MRLNYEIKELIDKNESLQKLQGEEIRSVFDLGRRGNISFRDVRGKLKIQMF